MNDFYESVMFKVYEKPLWNFSWIGNTDHYATSVYNSVPFHHSSCSSPFRSFVVSNRTACSGIRKSVSNSIQKGENRFAGRKTWRMRNELKRSNFQSF